LAAAYAYNVLAAPILDDAQFDKLCTIAAGGWDQLDPVRQWQLESPEATRATSMHFKYTAYTIGAARGEYFRLNKRYAPPADEDWKTDHMGIRYVTGAT
jgi:hypothetical protein